MKKITTQILFIVLFLFVQNTNASNIVTRTSGNANWSDASSWFKFLDGEIYFKEGSKMIYGKGTNFLRDLKPGDQILIENAPQKITGIVGKILSEVSLQLEQNLKESYSGAFGKTALVEEGDNVFIGNVYVNGNLNMNLNLSVCKIASLSFASTQNSLTLIHDAASVLSIEKDVVLSQPISNKQKNTWEIGSAMVNVDGSVSSFLSANPGNRLVEILVSGGTLNINKDFFMDSKSNFPEQKISIDHGKFTINGKFKMSSGIFTSKGNTTLVFNKEFVFGSLGLPQFNTDSSTNLVFNGDIDLRAMFSNLVFSPNSKSVIKSTLNIYTPKLTALLNFGNLQIEESANAVLNGNIWVAGNLVSKGGSIISGKNIVWLSGKNKSIDGTASANFGNISIYGGRSTSYTVVNNVSCDKVTFPPSLSNSSIFIKNGVTLTILGDLTILQPSAPAATSFNVGNGSAMINGDVTVGGKYQIASQVSRISIKNGVLDVSGDLVLNSSPLTPQTAMLDMAEGSGIINLKGKFINSNHMGLSNTGIDEKRFHTSEALTPSL